MAPALFTAVWIGDWVKIDAEAIQCPLGAITVSSSIGSSGWAKCSQSSVLHLLWDGAVRWIHGATCALSSARHPCVQVGTMCFTESDGRERVRCEDALEGQQNRSCDDVHNVVKSMQRA